MKALFIDVANKVVSEIQINDWTEIAPKIGNGCKTFACPVDFELGNGVYDTLYVDDEGLFNNVTGGIIMEDWSYPILGNQILLGTDQEGTMVDVTMKANELFQKIGWISKEMAIIYSEQFL